MHFQVGTNGIIGLGERYNSFVPRDLSSRETLGRRILCPFWFDLLTEGADSAVYYNVYKRCVGNSNNIYKVML